MMVLHKNANYCLSLSSKLPGKKNAAQRKYIPVQLLILLVRTKMEPHS